MPRSDTWKNLKNRCGPAIYVMPLYVTDSQMFKLENWVIQQKETVNST